MYLPKKYCRHFLLLVIATHLCESKTITSEQLLQIKILTSQFVYQFPLLYGDRQNVISVHSIIHLADSIRDFGGVYNYSTFNFESYLGQLNEQEYKILFTRYILENNTKINWNNGIVGGQAENKNKPRKMIFIIFFENKQLISRNSARYRDCVITSMVTRMTFLMYLKG